MADETKVILRCYAERDRDGSWFAMCLDLNLYARADSAEVVQQKLHQVIVDHVTTVMDLPESERKALLARPAPLRFRMRYAYLLARAVIGSLFHPKPPSANSSYRKFDEALPVA